MKKIIALLICLILIPSNTICFAQEGNWYDNITTYLIDNKVISDEYDLDGDIKRGEIADIVATATGANVNVDEIENPFIDLLPTNSHYKSILSLYKTNIFKGEINNSGDLVAMADEYLTREQAASFIIRAFDFPAGIEQNKISSSAFMDSDLISEYAKESVLKCRELGIICGYPNKSFKPQNTISKVEFLTMIYTSLILTSSSKTISQDVSLNILEDNITVDNLTITRLFTNSSDKRYGYGAAYQLEKLLNGEWITVESKHDIDDWLMVIKPHETIKDTINLKQYNDQLSVGAYRLIQPLVERIQSNSPEDDALKTLPIKRYYCITEFEIIE